VNDKLAGMSLLAICLLLVICSFTIGAYFAGRG
jgi:hypothetical protein